MAKKAIGYILSIIGALVAVIFLAADSLGIGRYPGINWAQMLGGAIGIIILLLGVWMASRKVIKEA